MKWSRVPADAPEEIRSWAELLHTLAEATGLPSQGKLAKALPVGTATLSRYLSAERLPDRPTVEKLVELARQHGGTIDERDVFRTYEAAEKAFAERRRRNRNPAENDVHAAADNAQRSDRNRRTPILLKAGIAAVIAAVAGFGIAISGAFQSDDTQTPTPRANATCVAESCAGRNHNGQGCDDDVRSLANNDNKAVIIDVMYSPTCQAAWGKPEARRPERSSRSRTPISTSSAPEERRRPATRRSRRTCCPHRSALGSRHAS